MLYFTRGFLANAMTLIAVFKDEIAYQMKCGKCNNILLSDIVASV